MKRVSNILLLFLTAILFTNLGYGKENLQLIPQPVEIKFHGGGIYLSGYWKITYPESRTDETYGIEILAKEAKDCFGWNWKVSHTKPKSRYIEIRDYVLKGDEPLLFKEQGYILTVEEGKIIIESPTAVGRFYGIQTLRQLLRSTKSGRIPKMRIMDYPTLEWRGVSDDISRGQVSNVDDFKKIIRQLAFYKNNIYQPYIEDMYSFNIDPNIGKERGAITKPEMAQMVEEARKNHIVLCPVFECLGHQDRLLSLPENRKYAEVQDSTKNPWSFSPVLPEATDFVESLIDEMANDIPSPFFHIGGDESFDIGDGTSKETVAQVGVGKVHGDYFSKLITHIEQKEHRQVMLYGDMLLRHRDAMKSMTKDCIIVDWHYGPEDDYPSVTTFKSAGFKNIIVSPGIWGWANFYPNYNMAFKNILGFTNVAKREGCMGSIVSAWGDDGGENLRENNWGAYAYAASASWEESTTINEDEFFQNFVTQQYGLHSPKLANAEKILGYVNIADNGFIARLFHLRPMIKNYNPNWMGSVKGMKKDMDNAYNTIHYYETKAKFNKEHLVTIDNISRRYLYLANRYEMLSEIDKMLGDKKSGELSEKDNIVIRKKLTELRDTLISLNSEYARLWLENNKYPMMDVNLSRIQRQVAELQSFITLLESGELVANSKPIGTWFWYPEGDPLSKSEIGKAYFVRTVELNADATLAEVRCWADDNAIVYVNGRKVVTVDYNSQPVTRNIRNTFKKGINHIAIEAENTIGAAGILLEIKIETPKDPPMMITGDTQWRANKQVDTEWKRTDPSGSDWVPVKLLGTGVIKPWDFIDW